ncbi:MAG: hypothetical protein ACE5FK_06165 [Candidatus Methylomirabilia bacterium]
MSQAFTRRDRVSRTPALVLAVVLLAAGCAAGSPLVLPVRLEPERLTAPVDIGPLTDYESAVRSIAAVIVAELGLPLPRRFTLFVYPTREAYERGLTRDGHMLRGRAAEVAQYSVGLGQHRRLFVNDGALRDAPQSATVRILAHELTHLAQYELSSGRRGSSEQWLREGMADWVTSRVLERFGAGTSVYRRQRALRTVAPVLPTLEHDQLDLVDLGRPLGWETRHLRDGGQLTYGLALLLTEDLIRRRGFESLVDYFRAFAESDDRFGHFHSAFGLSLDDFEAHALNRLRDEAQATELVPAPGRLDTDSEPDA